MNLFEIPVGEPRDTYTQYVHEYERNGQTRYAVGRWDEERGQYTRPHDQEEYKLTGCSASFARRPEDMQSYPTRRQALRRARYLYGPESEETL
jgi:hypothetical protein